MKQVKIAGILNASQTVFSRLLKKPKETGSVKERPTATIQRQDMLLLRISMSKRNVFFVSCVNLEDSPAVYPPH